MQHVLIADDHEVTRRGLREILRDAFSGVQVVEAADTAEVLAQLGTRDWDLILLDILMPGDGIISVIQRIREHDAAVPILVLTALTEIEYVLQTMNAGANGLIHKHRASDELLDAITKVQAGGSYLHPETAVTLATSLRAKEEALPHDKLSERELEIFKLIAQGKAIKEIAAELGISDKTVATYLSRIREKTGLISHVDIARYAMQHSLVD